MTVIAIANQGGSAGKTTAAVNLGALIALDGHRVRLVDLDSQANLSHWVGYSATSDTTTPTIADVLLDGVPLADAEHTIHDIPGLTVIPATPDAMEGVDISLGKLIGGEQRLRLAVQDDPTPDVVTIIDCPGTLGIITVAACIAANSAITVYAPTEKEAGAIARFDSTITEIARAYNPQLRLAAIIPSIVPTAAGRYYHDVTTQIQTHWGDLLTPPIRRSVRVPESFSAQRPVPLHTPTADVTTDLRRVHHHLAGVAVL